MDPFVAFQQYQALRLHFTTEKYDYTLYGGKTKNAGTVAAHRKFLANKHKMFYAQLARQADPEGLIVANLLVNPKAFITDLIGPDAQDTYLGWKGRQSRLMYQVSEDLALDDNWRRMTKHADNGLPHLINEYIGGRICPETIVVVDTFARKLDEWAAIEHPLMKNVQLKLRKYRPFVKFDKTKAKQAIQKLVKS